MLTLAKFALIVAWGIKGEGAVLPFLPTREDIVAEAEKEGWSSTFRRGKYFLKRENPGIGEVILQSIPDGTCYDHPTAVGYARVLGLKISGENDPHAWAPSEDEQN